MLRPRLPRLAVSLRRHRHFLPELKSEFNEGVNGLLTPNGFKLAWTQYQSHVLEKLNQQTQGSETDSTMKTKDLAIKYAREASRASIFNNASMAHNNHFFFNCLSNEPIAMPQGLKDKLEQTFGTIDALKAEMLATANAMFGPGFVWLVYKPDAVSMAGKFGIMATYIAGSPYPQAHFRQQSRDLNTEAAPTPTSIGEHARQGFVDSLPVANSVGSHGPLSRASKEDRVAPGGANVRPILCVNTWEHVWVPDWGIAGKPQFLEAWWNKIDWNVVADYAASRTA